MTRAFAAAAALALAWPAIGAAPVRTAALRGYTLANSVRERETEARFADMPSVQNALDISAVIGGRPHYAGTTGDYALALYMRDALRAAGISTELEPFAARVDTPRRLVLQLAPGPDAAPSARRLGRKARDAEFPVGLELGEIAEPSDPATAARGIGLPFNSGSADGDVRAVLVYADRGRDADYDTLARARVDVRGAIVLVRYGAQFRGLLAERAQSRGAAGVIFFSDPQDDGAPRGPVYPNGPWRPPDAVQRGSVGANVHIPTLPVSAANAQLLLSSLRGTAGPAGWGGALPVPYPLARGPGRVHLIVKLTRKAVTLWNTIGVIPGASGTQSVILGAHRDAWVFGVSDNGAGIATMLEVGRGLGQLLRGGWRPRRSIVIAGWDGEEIGLLGSRAYVRAHDVEIERGCIAYLNADQNITGPRVAVAAAAAIVPVVVEAARGVPDPMLAAGTVYDRWAAQTPRRSPHVDDPGGGSDHEPFLYDLGVPVASIGFAGPFGAYHSSYDTLSYATLFSDPGFALHRSSAQLYGLAALRLADADVVPYAFGGYITLLRGAVAQLALHYHGGIGAQALVRAIDRFARAAARADTLVVAARVDVSEREMRAARILNSLVYGLNGDASVAFPSLKAAFARRDRTAADAALANGAAAVTRATAALTR